jgi:hypothetical protein
MATAKVSPLSSQAQFSLPTNLDTREPAQESFALAHGCCPHVAIIQKPVRKCEKPWRHQRAIVLFAKSPEEMKLRLQVEGRMKVGEQLLQIVAVGGE